MKLGLILQLLYLYLQTEQSSGSSFTEKSTFVCVCVYRIRVSLKPFSSLNVYSITVLQFLTCPRPYVPCLPDPAWGAAPLSPCRAGSRGREAEHFCQLAGQLRDKDNQLSILALVSSQDILVLQTGVTLGSVPIFITVLLNCAHFAPFSYGHLSFFHRFISICGLI